MRDSKRGTTRARAVGVENEDSMHLEALSSGSAGGTTGAGGANPTGEIMLSDHALGAGAVLKRRPGERNMEWTRRWKRALALNLLFISTTFVALTLVSRVAAAGPYYSVEKVETPSAILFLKAGSGDLVGLQWKLPKLDIIKERQLGENFRILLPQPDYEANYFNSRDQELTEIKKTSTGVILYYNSLRNSRERVNVKVVYEIRDTGTQLQFSIQVDNGTDRRLAEVAYAMVGGQQGIGGRADTESLIPGDPTNLETSNIAPRVFSHFELNGLGSAGGFGTPFSSAGYIYPGDLSMGWMDIYNSKVGLGYYYANQDLETRVSALYMEVHPFTKDVSSTDNWPIAGELPAGEPIGLTMGWVNFPYTAKGSFHAGPVALQVHEGNWHKAANIYRGWFDQHFKMARPSNWLRQEMAWYSVCLLSPQDVVIHRFADLPKLAADAKRYGVTSILIFGWAVGGEDRERPNYIPDPRLGTREEFKKALADIRAIGVHPLLYGNVQWADTSTDAFRTRLSRYAVEGRWAPDRTPLYQFGPSTIGGRLMGITRHLAVISPSYPEYRQEIIGQYLDRIRDGAEGIEIDGGMIQGILDFNPNLSTSPDKSLPQGVQLTYEEFLGQARAINPGVALSLQDYFDRDFPYNDVSFMLLQASKDVAMPLRSTFPEWNFVALAMRPGDFDRLNNGLRYGLVWTIAPRGFTASMDEASTRPLSQYLSELIRIRKKYESLLFEGRYVEDIGVKVDGDKENIRYGVFEPVSSASQQRACVVVNFGDQQENVEVSIQGSEGHEATVSAPFMPDRVVLLPSKLVVRPHQVIVVVNKG